MGGRWRAFEHLAGKMGLVGDLAKSYWKCCGKREWTMRRQDALNAETGASLQREAEEWP